MVSNIMYFLPVTLPEMVAEGLEEERSILSAEVCFPHYHSLLRQCTIAELGQIPILTFF